MRQTEFQPRFLWAAVDGIHVVFVGDGHVRVVPAGDSWSVICAPGSSGLYGIPLEPQPTLEAALHLAESFISCYFGPESQHLRADAPWLYRNEPATASQWHYLEKLHVRDLPEGLTKGQAGLVISYGKAKQLLNRLREHEQKQLYPEFT